MDEITQSMRTFGECCAAAAKIIAELVEMWATTVSKDPVIVAYTVAAKEYPEWVHRAIYSKKKRTRKKYHDKIMRAYGRC